MAGFSARRPLRATGAAGATAIAMLLAGGALASCARGPVLRDGVYGVPERGFTMAAPPGAWQRVEADGADLALRRDDGALLSVASRCDAPLAPPATLARQLSIDLSVQRVLASEPTELAGAPGHAQLLEVDAGGHTLRVKTLTRVAAPCVQDFVLVAPVASRDAEAVFDAWCQSFRETPR
jgi:hypothetical protein